MQVWWGGDFEAPSPELALKFQEIAWMTANSYPRSCLSIITSTEEHKPKNEIITLDNYPNPFSSSTTINFQTAIGGDTKLTITDMLGRTVKTLFDEYRQKGDYRILFYRKDLPSGIYYYQLEIGSYKLTKKMMILD